MFTDEQVMLCLAGISYRGYVLPGSANPHVSELLQAPIERGLEALAPLRGGWQLVWGPAQYRGPLSLFDEKLVYVVQDTRRPSRYVIVLRGTNPISATDWLFGDLWTGRQTPWAYGDGTAHVSLSAALSLSIIKGLRSAGPRRGPSSRLWANVDVRLAELREATRSATEPLQHLIDGPLETLSRRFLAALQRLAAVHPLSTASPEPGDARLLEYLRLWDSELRARIFDVIDELADFAGSHIDHLLLSFIERDARLRSSLGVGSDLLTFLAAIVENADGPVDVTVSGHSKGGALASTVALWLAETQGTDGPSDERWDPGRRATVSCWSFAGPTAGDAAFARRSESLLGPRCHRVWNDLDIVPRAWSNDALLSIPDLYEPQVGRVRLVGELVDTIVHKVKPLTYTQLSGSLHEIHGQVEPRKPYYFAQLAYQHLDAYLSELELTPHGITQAVLFDQPSAL